jgi:hypothetical protein
MTAAYDFLMKSSNALVFDFHGLECETLLLAIARNAVFG